MKRRGFTLVELLIVIGIIGILSSIAMVSGSGATDVARVTKIVEGFQSISAAMNMYYADNATACDRGKHIKDDGKDEELTAEHILEGIKYYLKDTNSVAAPASVSAAEVGKYSISINVGTGKDNSWWLIYTLNSDSSSVGDILKSRAAALGLKKEVTESKGDDESEATIHAYDGKKSVCMKVR